jgi:hypothetical protein
MRHLIVCCDGTWNSPDQDSPTNVRRIFNALDRTDRTKQLSRYIPGVGTEGGLISRMVGGGFGVGLGFGPGRGLAANVLEAYHWLITMYEPEDRIVLFGFSRGAYTARSLAGLIAMCGLVQCGGTEQETWRRIKRVYRRYQLGYQDQQGRAAQDADQTWRDGLTFSFDPVKPKRIPVHFIGVWDTVGSLGLPDPWRWIAPGFSSRRYEFNDVRLNPYVPFAYHALAMDERRGPFSPTLWETVDPPPSDAPAQELRQVWFPGSHMDVGGGHRETGLSDRPLQWMIEQAEQVRVGISFHPDTVKGQVNPNPRDFLHDDDRTALGWLNPVLAPWTEPFLSLRPRAVPLVDPSPARPSPDVDNSVYDRQTEKDPPITSGPYRQTDKVRAGYSKTVEVFARDPWNDTGLYLEPGEYTFEAEGEWFDQDISSGPGGSTGLPDWRQPLVAAERISRSIGSVVGQCERLYRRVTGDQQASFIGAPREPDLPWMSLVCYVANGAATVNGRRNAGNQRLDIGTCNGEKYRVNMGGYLYAFANDAWGFYGNNNGSVRLTVTRTGSSVGTPQPQKPTPKSSSPQQGAVHARTSSGRSRAGRSRLGLAARPCVGTAGRQQVEDRNDQAKDGAAAGLDPHHPVAEFRRPGRF